jgi:aspartyl-tRNA(Asn)/glutamyl-tRNA(Gln) amidotransferase subunit A
MGAAALRRPRPLPFIATVSRGAAVTSIRLVAAMDARLSDLDVLVMPTTPIVAPPIAEVANPATFAARNAALLRNTAIVNFFDLCAVSLPLPTRLPVGVMLVARNGHDRRLFQIAAAAERLFSG